MTTDFLVIGGGVIGLNIARGLKREFADSRVTLIEKERKCGLHASGRNSGVLHAGFYYTADSLKAKFTRIGNKALTDYCYSKDIPVNCCGKLVVARTSDDLPLMDELLSRGAANGVELRVLSEEQARRIEPRVKTYQRALYSPTTATVDPTLVIRAMTEDARQEGVEIRCGVQYLGRCASGVRTSAGVMPAGYVVNAAGLYADQIARDFGFGEQYRILPFKGLYLYSDEPPGAVRTNVYPVPDLRNPFLGVHITVTANGRVKIGPTAIPALWREQYRGCENFRWRELAEILFRTSALLGSNPALARLAASEVLKYSQGRMVSLAARLLDGVKPEHYRVWGPSGIRAQLLDITKRELVTDFVLEGDSNSMHVLNAVSPGFTCSLPFADYVCSRIRTCLN